MVLPTVAEASKSQHTESSRSPASTQAAYCANTPRDHDEKPALCTLSLKSQMSPVGASRERENLGLVRRGAGLGLLPLGGAAGGFR
jgi:hypothetical protein